MSPTENKLELLYKPQTKLLSCLSFRKTLAGPSLQCYLFSMEDDASSAWQKLKCVDHIKFEKVLAGLNIIACLLVGVMNLAHCWAPEVISMTVDKEVCVALL